MTAAARYLSVLLAVTGLALGLFLGLNLLLGERALGGPEATRLASEWQQQSRGITYAPPITGIRSFKALRLADRLPEVNALAFGSSTIWGMTAALFPEQYRFYNFGSTGNPLANIIGEIEYLLAHHRAGLRLMVVPLEWAIGSVTDMTPPPSANLSPSAVLVPAAQQAVPLHRKLRDALSYPKVVNLLQALRSIARAPDPAASFSDLFFTVADAPYACADGTMARDFDVINRGLCSGFRFDGSWSFGGEKRLTPARAALLSRAAAAPSSKFSHALCAGHGEPNPEYLRRLGDAAHVLEKSGGRMLLLLPPLIPEMEQMMSGNPGSRACLNRTKAVLDDWAKQHDVTVLDAGRSERYGCVAGEFLDEHHAYPECHRRVLDFYFRAQREGRARPGLLQP